MKRTYFLKSLFFAFILIFNSCSSDSDNGNDGDDGGNGGGELTSIVLSTAAASNIFTGDQIFFSITGNNGMSLNTLAEVKANGTVINGNAFTATTPGVFEFVATYNNLTSNAIQITVVEPPTKFVRNVLIEDYTGTWCGYCPRVSYGIEQVAMATDNAVTVAIHRGNTDPNGNNYDPYNFSAGALENMINLQGYPTAMLNRTTEWTYPEPSNVNQVVDLANTPADVGLAITPTLTGSDISIDVKVKFGSMVSSNAKLIVYILEDDLVFNQVNYTSYYGGSSVIANFNHEHVLRACLTNLLGDTIPASEVVEDNVHTQTISVSVPNNVVDTSKINVVAFVVNGITNAVYNARSANFGDTQSIEEL